MAVKNSLVTKNGNAKQNVISTFMANGMEVKLTPDLVRNYLVSGEKDRVSFEEIAMFINLCKFNGLNPWLREAYCIKYGTEPATMVVGKEAYLKRAETNPHYDGADSGVIVVDDQGVLTYRTGTFVMKGEEIVGGWAEVYRKDREHSCRAEVSFDEYAGRKKDGSLNRQWASKPATMIKKVALVQALKEAFPTNIGGMVTAEETGSEYVVDVTNVQVQPVEEPKEAKEVAKIEQKPELPAAAQAEADDVAGALFGE